MTMKVKKASFKVLKDKPLAQQEQLQIFSLAPTSEDGKSGEVIMKIKRLLDPKEKEVTIACFIKKMMASCLDSHPSAFHNESNR